jgi:TRAP-type uncharacterized transport system substrate-binding protein
MLPSIRRHTAGKQELPPRQYSAGNYHLWWPLSIRHVGFIIAILFLPLTAFMTAQDTVAQQFRNPRRPIFSQQQLQQALQKKHNDAAVMMLGGRPGTTYFSMAHDIGAVSSAGTGSRMIVVDAPGGIESLRDLLLLRGIDLALVPRNVLDGADETGAAGPGLRERLAYVTVLYSEEIHVLAGAGVASVKGLSGKKIAVPPDDGNAEFTVHDLLQRLRIEAEVVKIAAADAIDDVRSGALGALVLLGGKPLHFVAGLPKDGGIRLLAVPSQALGDEYSPGSFGAGDYPSLIPSGQAIDTGAVGVVVVANKTAPSDEASQRIARFIPALFGSMSDLTGPRWHPKWGEVNLAATLAKWSRVPAAKEWLDTALREQSTSVQKDFEEFLRVNGLPGAASPAVRKQLFDEYLKWTRGTTTAPR